MATFVAFAPTPQAPFEFQATLDGSVYTVVVTWNIFGRRYYVNVYALDQTLIVALPMIGSPDDYDISLVAGYFASTLVFRQANAQFEINP